jgi:hypothetical protein
MKRIFKDRKHPPDQRTETFTPVVANGGTYWRYHRADAKVIAPPRNSVPSTGQPVVHAPPSAASFPAAALPPPSRVMAPAAIVATPPVTPAPDATAAEKPTVIPAEAAPMVVPDTAKLAPAASPQEGLGTPGTATPAQPPAAATAAQPPPDATAAIATAPAKKVQRKKRQRPDFDLTKPLQ